MVFSSLRELDRTVLANIKVLAPVAGQPRIGNAPMGQELTAELNTFEVDFTSAGNMRVDVRSKGKRCGSDTCPKVI